MPRSRRATSAQRTSEKRTASAQEKNTTRKIMGQMNTRVATWNKRICWYVCYNWIRHAKTCCRTFSDSVVGNNSGPPALKLIFKEHPDSLARVRFKGQLKASRKPSRQKQIHNVNRNTHFSLFARLNKTNAQALVCFNLCGLPNSEPWPAIGCSWCHQISLSPPVVLQRRFLMLCTARGLFESCVPPI